MKKKVIAYAPVVCAVTFLVFVTCVAGRFANKNVAIKLLASNGFTKINLVDRTSTFVGLKGCDKGDLTLFTFKAVNSLGKPVTVKVCQGWPFKGATIRGL